jgi:hypothetical protein
MKSVTAVACVLPLLIAASPGWSTTLVVDCTGGGDFGTIGEALAVAANGDTIAVRPCVYTEQVSLLNRELTIVGSGAENTVLYWDGSEPTLVVDHIESGLPARGRSGCSIEGLTIEHLDNSSVWYLRPAVRVHGTTLELVDCRVVNGAWAGSDPMDWWGDADIHATRCSFDRLRVWGQEHEPTVLNECDLAYMETAGGGDETGATTDAVVFSSGCRFERIWAHGGTLHSNADSVGYFWAQTDVHTYLNLDASHSTIRRLELWDGMPGPRASLTSCTVDSVYWYAAWGGTLSANSCVVGQSNLFAEYCGVELVHCTFTEPVEVQLDATGAHVSSCIFDRGVSGEVAGEALFSHNDFVVPHQITGGTFVSNLEATPLFCGPEVGDYTLQSCSPCVGAAHDGGDIGAFGVGCECFSPAEVTSWGKVKALFRRPPD